MRGVNLEDSWKGEILPGFLFLGDRVTASDMDRLTTLEVTHILNATEDVSNFFEGSSHLKYMRCPIKDRSEAASDIATHFDACVDFINDARASNGARTPSLPPPPPLLPCQDGDAVLPCSTLLHVYYSAHESASHWHVACKS